MQKWEYLYAYLVRGELQYIEVGGVGELLDEGVKLRKELGLGTGKISRAQFLKWCGQNGWDMCGFESKDDALMSSESMVFKRPL